MPGSKLGEAFVPIRAKLDKFEKDLRSAREKLNGAMKGMAKGAIIGGGALAAGAAIGAVKFASDSISAFVPFEKQMNEVFTLLPNLSGEAMDKMTQQALDFASRFGTLPENVVPALYQAISAGVPADNVFDFLATAQKAATGGVAELETSVDGISSVVNAYGSDVLDAAQASDLMFTAVKLGKTDFEQLSNSLFNVIPTASALGVEFGDVTAALAAMTAQGTPTSVATTQLRQLFVELSKSTSKTAKVFENIAGVGFKEFIAQGGSVQDALMILEQAAQESGVNISDLFGSVEAGNAALALTGKGTESFSKNLQEMSQSTGATQTAFDQMERGVGKTQEKLTAFMETIKISVGDSLSPMLEALVNVGQNAMPQIQEAITKVKPVLAAFAEEFSAKLGPAIAVVNDALTRIANALFGAGEPITIVDFLIGGLSVTLDLVVTALEAVAVTASLVASAIETVAGWVQKVTGFFEKWGDKLSEIDLPDWLVPGSPTPLEIGLRGIVSAAKLLPDMSASFSVGNAQPIALGGEGKQVTINIDGVSLSSEGGIEEALTLMVKMLKEKLQQGES